MRDQKGYLVEVHHSAFEAGVFLFQDAPAGATKTSQARIDDTSQVVPHIALENWVHHQQSVIETSIISNALVTGYFHDNIALEDRHC